jgi:hypothetical protein
MAINWGVTEAENILMLKNTVQTHEELLMGDGKNWPGVVTIVADARSKSGLLKLQTHFLGWAILACLAWLSYRLEAVVKPVAEKQHQSAPADGGKSQQPPAPNQHGETAGDFKVGKVLQ